MFPYYIGNKVITNSKAILLDAIDDLDLLSEIYNRFLKQNQLPKMSADDLLNWSGKKLHTFKKQLNDEQKYYIAL